MLAPNGVMASYRRMADPKLVCPAYPLMLKNATLRFVLVYDMPEEAKQQGARDVNAPFAAGGLQQPGAGHKIARPAHQNL